MQEARDPAWALATDGGNAPAAVLITANASSFTMTAESKAELKTVSFECHSFLLFLPPGKSNPFIWMIDLNDLLNKGNQHVRGRDLFQNNETFLLCSAPINESC